MVRFTLYVAGDSTRSQRAIADLQRFGEERLGGAFEFQVVDVQRDPDAAERDGILTTPTLIKTAPGTPRRVTGDLADFEQVLAALSLPRPES